MDSPHPPSNAPEPDLSSIWAALAAIGASLQQLAAAAQTAPIRPPDPLTHSPPPPPPIEPDPPANPTDPPSHGDTTLTVTHAINEYLVYQARMDRSDRYLRQLRVVFRGFARGRSTLPISDLTAAAVGEWAEAGGRANYTRRRYLADLKAFLDWCRRRGWCKANAAAEVRVPKVIDTRSPSVHTPDQVRTILEAARVADLDICRHLAIRYFAGLRTSEALQMTEADIRREESILVVPARVAKTRRRRIVRICPTLDAWLALGGTLRGMRPETIRLLIRTTGIEWPPNVTRHSWCSYHLATHESAAKTALEAGHSETMLFAHYRALVTPTDAAQFWAIVPTGNGGK